MADLEHSQIPDSGRHEPKGASTASTNQTIKSDGAGGTSFGFINYSEIQGAPTTPIGMGIWDYNDLNTATTPITMVAADTPYELTNDGLGPFTNTTYALPSVINLWNTGTNRFNFSDLNLGDTVDIRLDVELTTTGVNSAVSIDLELGLTASPYLVPILNETLYKAAGSHFVNVYNSVYMGDNNTKDNSARFVIQSDNAGDSVKVNGWYLRVLSSV